MLTWAAMLDSPARVVGRTSVGDASVSTVWFGLATFHDIDAPLIYESMVFYANGDDEMYRYATLAEARAGHERLVAELELLAAALDTSTRDEPQA